MGKLLLERHIALEIFCCNYLQCFELHKQNSNHLILLGLHQLKTKISKPQAHKTKTICISR